MPFRVTQDIAAAMTDAGVALFTGGAGAGPAELQIMSGALPADIDTALTTQEVLVAFDLPEPLFNAAVPTSGGATATANTIASAPALPAAGAGVSAGWFRVLDKDGNVVADGEVTDTAGAGPLKLANTTIVEGVDVTIVSWTSFHPI